MLLAFTDVINSIRLLSVLGFAMVSESLLTVEITTVLSVKNTGQYSVFSVEIWSHPICEYAFQSRDCPGESSPGPIFFLLNFSWSLIVFSSSLQLINVYWQLQHFTPE